MRILHAVDQQVHEPVVEQLQSVGELRRQRAQPEEFHQWMTDGSDARTTIREKKAADQCDNTILTKPAWI